MLKNEEYAILSGIEIRRKNEKPILSIKNLKTYFHTFRGLVKAVDSVTFDVPHGSIVGLAGESGCGKSVTCLSILKVVPIPGRIEAGEIIWKGEDLVKKNEKEMNRIRGNKISMIFQDPEMSLNPVFKVGYQASKFVSSCTGITRTDARDKILDTFDRVDLPDPLKTFEKYPHELSGGMLQRVMIAIAISCAPDLLIADEPTTSLDVTTQAKILDLIMKLQREEKLTVLIISHNLALLSYVCDYIVIMYNGNVLESGTVENIISSPKHPYTQGLIKAIPTPDRTGNLFNILGDIPDPLNSPSGCKFHPRCLVRKSVCSMERPRMIEIKDKHLVSCFLYYSHTKG